MFSTFVTSVGGSSGPDIFSPRDAFGAKALPNEKLWSIAYILTNETVLGISFIISVSVDLPGPDRFI